MSKKSLRFCLGDRARVGRTMFDQPNRAVHPRARVRHITHLHAGCPEGACAGTIIIAFHKLGPQEEKLAKSGQHGRKTATWMSALFVINSGLHDRRCQAIHPQATSGKHTGDKTARIIRILLCLHMRRVCPTGRKTQ